jgi:hypothetical protein
MGIYLDIIKRWNCSVWFLLPLLRIGRKKLEENGFIDSFLDDASRERLEGWCLYLLFRPLNLVQFSEFLEEQRKVNEVIDDYDYEGGFVVIVYKLDDKWEDDYQLFHQGKYSKFSDEFKNLFPKRELITIDGKRRDEVTLQWSVFKKSKLLVQQWKEEIDIDLEDELWSAPKTDREVLSQEYIDNYLNTLENVES